jgi:hypothetical protein
MTRQALRTISTRIALALVLTASAHVTNATQLNTELLINGGAETGTTAGWLDNGMEVVSTNTTGKIGLPNTVDIGLWSFQGGLGNTSQTLSQSVSVADLASTIDSGIANAHFSILVQSRLQGNKDIATGKLVFSDETGAAIASVAFGDPSIVSGIFDWSQVNYNLAIPTGTRKLSVELLTTRSSGDSTDAYFDNASLSISAVPEPTSLVLSGVGFCIALIARKRKLA